MLDDCDQGLLRRLENSDYLRVLISRHEPRALVQLGGPHPDDPEMFLWGWEMELSAGGVAALATSFAQIAEMLAERSRSLFEQTKASLLDAQSRLAEPSNSNSNKDLPHGEELDLGHREENRSGRWREHDAVYGGP